MPIFLQSCVYSLAATIWSAADWRLTEAQKPSLSTKLQELLVSMTDDDPDVRLDLDNVLQVSDSVTNKIVIKQQIPPFDE